MIHERFQIKDPGKTWFDLFLYSIAEFKGIANVGQAPCRPTREVCRSILDELASRPGERLGKMRVGAGWFGDDAIWPGELPTAHLWFKWNQAEYANDRSKSPKLSRLDSVARLLHWLTSRSDEDSLKRIWLRVLDQQDGANANKVARLGTVEGARQCLYSKAPLANKGEGSSPVVPEAGEKEPAIFLLRNEMAIAPLGTSRDEFQRVAELQGLAFVDPSGLDEVGDVLRQKLTEDFNGSSLSDRESLSRTVKRAYETLTSTSVSNVNLLPSDLQNVEYCAWKGSISPSARRILEQTPSFHVAVLSISPAAVAALIRMRAMGIPIILHYYHLTGSELASSLEGRRPYDFMVAGEPGLHMSQNQAVGDYRYMFQVFESPQFLVTPPGGGPAETLKIYYAASMSSEEAVRLHRFSDISPLGVDAVRRRVEELDKGEGIVLWSAITRGLQSAGADHLISRPVSGFRNALFSHKAWTAERYVHGRNAFGLSFIAAWNYLRRHQELAMSTLLKEEAFLAYFALGSMLEIEVNQK